MIWLKSALVGLAAAFVTIAVIVALVFATASWHIDDGEGGGIASVSFGFSDVLMLPVILAFATGFWWSMRRQRRRRSLPRM